MRGEEKENYSFLMQKNEKKKDSSLFSLNFVKQRIVREYIKKNEDMQKIAS